MIKTKWKMRKQEQKMEKGKMAKGKKEKSEKTEKIFLVIGAAPYKTDEIERYKALISTYIKNEMEVFVCCADGGLLLARDMYLSPDMIIGDFDSMPRGVDVAKIKENDKGEINKPNSNVRANTIVEHLSPIKDNTDLMVCVKKGLALKYRKFILLGVTGGRIDHFMGALSVLEYLNENEAEGFILDSHNEIRFFNSPFSITIENNETLNIKNTYIEKDNINDINNATETKAMIKNNKAFIIDNIYKYFSINCLDYEITGLTIKGAKYEIENFKITRVMDRCISNEIIEGQATKISAKSGRGLLIRSS